MTSVDILDWYKPLIPKDCPSFWVVLWPGKQKDSTTHNKNLIDTNFKVSTCPASGVIKTTLCRTPPAVDAINGQPTNFCNPWRDYNNTYVCNWRKYISCVLPNRKSSIFSCSKQTIIRVGDLIQIWTLPDDALRRLHPGLNRNRKQATCECTGEPIDSVHWFVIDGKQMKNRPFSLVHSPSFTAGSCLIKARQFACLMYHYVDIPLARKRSNLQVLPTQWAKGQSPIKGESFDPSTFKDQPLKVVEATIHPQEANGSDSESSVVKIPRTLSPMPSG